MGPMARRARGAVRPVLGGVVAVLAALALAALSQVPYTATGGEAELRLAWRARVPRVEECRRLTPEEQAALPAHMRREEVCEGRVASYLLRVAVDGRTVRLDTVAGAGARGDRPLYVSEAIRLRPGAHDVAIAFTRLGVEASEGEEGEESSEGLEGEEGWEDRETSEDREASDGRAGEGPGRRGEGVPDRLLLRRTVELEPRGVALVTYDPERRRLELRRPGSTR